MVNGDKGRGRVGDKEMGRQTQINGLNGITDLSNNPKDFSP